MESKEGGWGWLVTFSSFWVHFVTCGVAYSCGIMHQIYLHEFGKTHFETSWIAAILLSLSVLAGIPSLVLTYQIGVRCTVMAGGVLACVGFVLSRFATHLYEVYLTTGVVSLGFGLALTPSVLIIESYFYEKHGFARSVATSGVSMGIFAFPVALYELVEHIGLKNTALVLAAICLTIAGVGATMKPKSDVGKRRDYIKMFRPVLFKSIAFIAIMVSNFIWSTGAAIIYTYLPAYVIQSGHMTLMDSSILIAVSGVSALTSRTIFVIFSQSAKLDHCSTFLCTVVLTGIMTGLFPEMFKLKAGEIGYAIILGLHCGYWSTFVGGVAEELIGKEYIGYGKGYVILSIGLGMLSGPPIAGWTFDKTNELEIAFYLGGACMLFSSILVMIINMRKCYFRFSLDWSDSESETSLGSRASQSNQVNAEEHRLVVTSLLSTV